MIKELIDRYKLFHDATIEKVSYSSGLNEVCDMVIIMNAFSHENDFEFEKIEITFNEVLSFRLIETYPFSALIITCAIFNEEDHHIIADFFPTSMWIDWRLMKHPILLLNVKASILKNVDKENMVNLGNQILKQNISLKLMGIERHIDSQYKKE